MSADDDYAQDLRDWIAEEGQAPDGIEPLSDLPSGDYGKEVLIASPSAPLSVARWIYRRFRLGNGKGAKTLVSWRGTWTLWRTPHWSELDTAQLRSHIYRTLQHATYEHQTKDGIEVRNWNPDKRKVANVVEAMEALAHLGADIDPPAWIGLHSATETPAAQMISCRNGLLDISARTVHDHSPALFNVVSVPFDYQADAPKPVVWFDFLAKLWPDDPESVALLQEYMGYVLSGRTNQQKMLLLIGPTRSGKGTIARVLTQLVGRGHVAGPTLASLGTNFGLSPLLGKPLAIISDARLGDTPAHVVVERLLSITGEDMLTVDRKFRDPWSGKLPTRFVILSNELPRFRDSSAAIANRMVILQTTESFLGREDLTLDDRLRPDLAGILTWALEGLDRLNRNGRFTVPKSSDDAAALMMDMASPVSAFVRDCCVREPGASVLVDALYGAWKAWAEDNGHHAGSKSTLGRNLRAVVPEVKVSQPTIAGKRAKCYVHIGLVPMHPVHGDESAGQRAAADFGHPVHARADADSPDRAASVCTGCGTAPDDGYPLVNGLCTGCTGGSPLRVQYQGAGEAANAAYRNGMCRDCGVNPHSAGRPRCGTCHQIWLSSVDGYNR